MNLWPWRWRSSARSTSISVDRNGLHLSSDDATHTDVAWREIEQIYAFKKDLWLVDQIRLLFYTADQIVWFSEEDPGFAEVPTALQDRLGIAAEWYLKLAQAPAFHSDLTRLFLRSGAIPALNVEDEVESPEKPT